MPRHTCLIWAAALILAAQSVAAQESDIEGRLSIELNAAETVGEACKLSFLIIFNT